MGLLVGDRVGEVVGEAVLLSLGLRVQVLQMHESLSSLKSDKDTRLQKKLR